MKRIVKIFFVAALLLGVVSCTDLLDEALRGRGAANITDAGISEFPVGARLTLGFNVPMPVATKAMTEDPEIKSIHVFVFVDNGVSDNGVLFEVQKAELGGLVNKNAIMDYDQTYGTDGINGHISNFDDNTVLARWQVNLLMSRTKRRLHFVANLPEGFAMPEAGTAEFSVMRSIQTAGDDVAYWQMVELEHGVLAYTYDGTGKFSYIGTDGTKVEQSVSAAGIEGWQSYDSGTGTYHYKDKDGAVIDVAKGDYIATTGHKILDGKGFYASEELSETVSMIPLIRNFARIKVVAAAGTGHNFRLDSAVLINVPGSGYVAPFDDHSNHFVEAYRNAGSTALSHDVIFNAGYPASIPPDTIVTKCPAEAVKAATVNNRDTVLLYMYERGIPTKNPTSLLVKGSLSDGEKRWFKIEIADENGSYFPIYRDFTYEVEIKSISGSDGYKTMEEAWKTPAIGDISSSPETETLTQISDGNLTLWVSYIDTTTMQSTPQSATLLYKFYDTQNLTRDNVTLTVVPVEGREAAIDTTSSGSGSSTLTGTPYSGNGPDKQTGWYQVNVPLRGAGSEPKISTLHVEGKKPGGKTFFRNVTFRVMQKRDFTLLASTLDSQAAGDTATLSVTLPPYLGYSVFPLTLMIEAQAGNLNPGGDENLSVESGTSLFGTGKNAFYFLKTISYSEYQANRTYPIVFKTTVDGESTASGTNATMIAVKDKDGYFNTGTTPLTVLPVGISPVEQTVKGSASSATFRIVSNMDGISNFSWNITDVTGGATFTAYSGTTSGAVTMNFDAITDLAASGKEYTAKFTYFYSLDGQTYSETVDLKVHQTELKYVVRTETVSKSFALSNDSSIQITDDNNDGTSVTLTHGSGIEFYHSNSTGDWFRSNGNSDFTLIFTPSSNITITKVSLDWSGYNYRPDSITISGGASGNIPIGNNATSGSWEGSSDSSLTARMTRRSQQGWQTTYIDFRFKTITVDYEYTKAYYE